MKFKVYLIYLIIFNFKIINFLSFKYIAIYFYLNFKIFFYKYLTLILLFLGLIFIVSFTFLIFKINVINKFIYMFFQNDLKINLLYYLILNF